MKKNPESFECLTCWNDSAFEIFDIERINRTSWNVLLKCIRCGTGMTFRFDNFKQMDLRHHLNKLIGEHRAKEKPTSYKEWSLVTKKTYIDSHPNGQYQEIEIN